MRTHSKRSSNNISRREFLGAGLAAAMAWPAASLFAAPTTNPRIAIVGAGLAGLTCAYRLRQAGYAAKLYEAATHVGGRCRTRRDFFDAGQIAERGGELIDTGHRAIRALAKELGFALDDLTAAEAAGTESFYYFNGASYSAAQAEADFMRIYPKLQDDLKQAGYPTLYDKFTVRGWQLDHMSVTDWINESVPGGVNAPLGRLLDIAYNIEFGAESTQQSALNLIYLLGYSSRQHFETFGESDERFHVRGGNDQVTTKMAQFLGNQIETATQLVAFARNSDGTFDLTLTSGSTTRVARADHVVLALPFAMLRDTVDLRRAGFSALKQTAINEQGMGANSKLHLQFTRRHWNALGCNGETLADTGYQNTWEVSRAQAGTPGLLVDYTGGVTGTAVYGGSTQNCLTCHGATTPVKREAEFHTSPDNAARQFLQQIEPVLPGLSALWNGKATLDYWPSYPWTHGSYSFWKVGQYTKFAGIERQAEGNCHFAGEHTSVDFQGYLNGAVESGERAASEIVAALR